MNLEPLFLLVRRASSDVKLCHVPPLSPMEAAIFTALSHSSVSQSSSSDAAQRTGWGALSPLLQPATSNTSLHRIHSDFTAHSHSSGALSHACSSSVSRGQMCSRDRKIEDERGGTKRKESCRLLSSSFFFL